jgi:hypothetical protein
MESKIQELTIKEIFNLESEPESLDDLPILITEMLVLNEKSPHDIDEYFQECFTRSDNKSLVLDQYQPFFDSSRSSLISDVYIQQLIDSKSDDLKDLTLFKNKYFRDNIIKKYHSSGKSEEKKGYLTMICENSWIWNEYINDLTSLDLLMNKVNKVLDLNKSYSHFSAASSQDNNCSSAKYVNFITIMMLTIAKNAENLEGLNLDLKEFNESDDLINKIIINTIRSIRIGFLSFKKFNRSSIKVLYKNESLRYDITEFHKKIINFCLLTKSKLSDDFITDVAEVLLMNINDNPIFDLTEEIYQFMIQIINNEIITNKHTRIMFTMAILKFTELRGYSKIGRVSNDNHSITDIKELFLSLSSIVADIDYLDIITPNVANSFHSTLLSCLDY